MKLKKIIDKYVSEDDKEALLIGLKGLLDGNDIIDENLYSILSNYDLDFATELLKYLNKKNLSRSGKKITSELIDGFNKAREYEGSSHDITSLEHQFIETYSKLIDKLFSSDVGLDCLITIMEMVELREISIYKVFNNFLRFDIKDQSRLIELLYVDFRKVRKWHNEIEDLRDNFESHETAPPEKRRIRRFIARRVKRAKEIIKPWYINTEIITGIYQTIQDELKWHIEVGSKEIPNKKEIIEERESVKKYSFRKLNRIIHELQNDYDNFNNTIREIVATYEGLIHSIAKGYLGKGVEYGKLVSIGTDALFRAVLRYNFLNRNYFDGYITWCIRQAIIMQLVSDKNSVTKLDNDEILKLIEIIHVATDFCVSHEMEPSYSDIAKKVNLEEQEILRLLDFDLSKKKKEQPKIKRLKQNDIVLKRKRTNKDQKAKKRKSIYTLTCPSDLLSYY